MFLNGVDAQNSFPYRLCCSYNWFDYLLMWARKGGPWTNEIIIVLERFLQTIIMSKLGPFWDQNQTRSCLPSIFSCTENAYLVLLQFPLSFSFSCAALLFLASIFKIFVLPLFFEQYHLLFCLETDFILSTMHNAYVQQGPKC